MMSFEAIPFHKVIGTPEERPITAAGEKLVDLYKSVAERSGTIVGQHIVQVEIFPSHPGENIREMDMLYIVAEFPDEEATE